MPRPLRVRVMDVPREPQRVRRLHSAIGVEWRPTGDGGYTDGTGNTDWAVLIRDEGPLLVELPARPEHPKPTWNGSRTTADLLAYGEEMVGYLANVASECMQDNLGDEQTVRDMHDAIGALSSLRSALQLIDKEASDGSA
jgi:hypothetical protein